MRWSVGRGLAVWVACSLAGVAVIAFPDDGRRLASFSDGHGPSAVDAAGIVVLIIGWLPFVVALWTARSAIEHRGALIVLAAIGALLVLVCCDRQRSLVGARHRAAELRADRGRADSDASASEYGTPSRK
jgi:hypothetical protein